MSKKSKTTATAAIEAPEAIEAATATATAIEAPEAIDAATATATATAIEAPAAGAPESTPEASEAPASNFRPVTGDRPRGFARIAARDRYGYAEGSYTSRLAAALSTPEGATRAELLRDALDVSEDSAPNVRKARGTTLSVFLSDSRRSPGTYPVSRAFVLEEDDSTGKLRFSVESIERAERAVRDGLLAELREVKTESARRPLLARFGF